MEEHINNLLSNNMETPVMLCANNYDTQAWEIGSAFKDPVK